MYLCTSVRSHSFFFPLLTLLDTFNKLHCLISTSLINPVDRSISGPCTCGAFESTNLKATLTEANKTMASLNEKLDFIPTEIEAVYSVVCEGDIGIAWRDIYEAVWEDIWETAIEPISLTLTQQHCVTIDVFFYKETWYVCVCIC